MLGIALFSGALLPAHFVWSDSVWVQSSPTAKPFEQKDVKVDGADGDKLMFTNNTSGRQASRKFSEIPQIKLDDDPVFSAAEEAFANGNWTVAGENYRKALGSSSKQWVKDRSSLRLVQASDKSGNFTDAVSGFVELMRTKPALASDHKPQIPKDHPELLDGAIASVKQVLQDPRLNNDQKSVLLNYLLELYGAKGDAAGVNSVMAQLGKVAPTDTASPEARKIQADGKLTQARQMLNQKQYSQALQTIQSNGALFTEPGQQAEALFVVAQAKAALAPADNADQLKDAALAYMRIVANFRTAEGQPHVAEALFSTAQIEEKLKNPKEAMALYHQITAEFKGTPLANAAAQNAARIAAAPKG
jgi:hypothetical protein